MSSGKVVLVRPGVYAGVRHASTAIVRGEALNLWRPRALVSGELALHLYDERLPVPVFDDLIVASGDKPWPMPRVRVRQVGPPTAYADGRGVRCVPPATALLDAWHRSEPHRRERVLYAALWTRVCSWKQLRAELRRIARVRGRRQLLAILAWFERGAHSPLEIRAARDVFVGRDFAAFERQAELEVAGRRVRADMLHREAKVVIELDGAGYHGSYAATVADHRRDADLAGAGYVTLRFGWDDIVRRPAWCRSRVLQALRARQ